MSKTEQSKITQHLPNIISWMRIVAVLILLLTEPLSLSFYLIYTFCGISDILDGYIARKTSSVSKFGAALDSISDFVFSVIVIIILLPIIEWKSWIVLWFVAIAAIRLLTLAVCFIKFRKFAFLHTYLNKATGFLIFLLVFTMSVFSINVSIIIACSIATLSAIEELAIMLKSKKIDRDIKSIIERYN